MTGQLFVHFKKGVQIPDGFKENGHYPVFDTSVIDLDDGKTRTEFLMANVAGEFRWIPMSLLLRTSPPKQG
jgi:hypothetical protein